MIASHRGVVADKIESNVLVEQAKWSSGKLSLKAWSFNRLYELEESCSCNEIISRSNKILRLPSAWLDGAKPI